MQGFKHVAGALRFECVLAGSICRSRGCLASKAVLLLGLGYDCGPWALAPDRLPFLGYLDEFLFAVLAIAIARLLVPADFEFQVAERYGFSNRDVARQRLWLARLRSTALTQWLLTVRRLRLFGSRLQARRRRVGVCLRAASRQRGLPGRLFALIGYRWWWRLRSPFARRCCDNGSIVVIGGSPRSGTTLLRTMLGRHPLIASGPESTVFLRRISSPADLGERFGWNPAEIARWQRDSRSQVEFIERFGAAVLQRSAKQVWAEKTPHNVFRFGFVRRHFPRAKLVHIVRDGRDVVCSLRRTSFAKLDHAPSGSAAAACRCGVQWRNAVRAGLRFRRDPAYYELRYEDLVDAPEPALRGLLDFLGLPWDDAVLRGETLQRREPDETAAAGNVFGSSVQRWRQDLSAEDQRALRLLIGPLLLDLGYASDLGWESGESGDIASLHEQERLFSD